MWCYNLLMLSFLPQLLFLAPAATALLRIVVALYLAYIAYSVFVRKDAMVSTRFPIVGQCGPWLVWLSGTVMFLIALMLFIGLGTQIAAIAGAVVALKYVIFARRYPEIIALPRSTSLLLLVICLSLIVSGAGAFAFDWPL